FLVTGASPYAAYYSATIGAEIEAMVRDFAADVVVIEGVELSAYVPHVRSTTARVVYDADEVETNKHRGIASTDGHRGRAMLRRHLAQRVESLEAEAIGSADQVWYC